MTALIGPTSAEQKEEEVIYNERGGKLYPRKYATEAERKEAYRIAHREHMRRSRGYYERRLKVVKASPGVVCAVFDTISVLRIV